MLDHLLLEFVRVVTASIKAFDSISTLSSSIMQWEPVQKKFALESIIRKPIPPLPDASFQATAVKSIILQRKVHLEIISGYFELIGMFNSIICNL